jgi:DNA-binding NarL/FixJ family response regulator
MTQSAQATTLHFNLADREEGTERPFLVLADPQQDLAGLDQQGEAAPLPPLPTLRALDIERCADALAKIGGLTVRERAVLIPLLRGRQNEEIAQSTRISKRGVRFHVSNILRKLRIENRAELIRFFF